MAFEIAALLGTAKSLATVAREAGKLELWEKALDFRDQVQSLSDENIQLKGQLRRLEEALEWKGRLHFAQNAYWSNETTEPESGPYCTRCYDVDRKAVRMIYRNLSEVFCQNCRTHVKLDGKDKSPPFPYGSRSYVGG